MIIPKEEVEKAAINYSVDVNGVSSITCEEVVFNASVCDFKAGVEFSEKYVQKYVQDIIIENQGLKLYKDNEAKRFKKLAIEFGEWIGRKEYSYYNPGSDTVSSWFDKNNHSLDCNTNELFETFIKERDETNS